MRIPFLNIEVLTKKGANNYKHQSFLQKFGFDLNQMNQYGNSARPPLTYPESFSQDDGIKIPVFPIPYNWMYDAARQSDILVTIINSLKKEILRNGLDKRKRSDAELKDKEPSEEQERALEILMTKHVNLNDQDLMDIVDQVEHDLEVADVGYLISLKDYIRNPKGEILSSKPEELLRGNPVFMRVISDRTGRPGRNQDGVPMWTCIDHRGEAVADEKQPVCGFDQMLMHRTYYVANNDSAYGHGPGTTPLGAGGRVYYIENEVYHRNKYEKNFSYGASRIIAAWPAIQILGSMNELMRNAYANQRFPRRIPMVASRNPEAMEKSIQALIQRQKNNPEMPPFLMVPTDKKGKFVEMLDMMATLDEMQFTEVRNELRRVIGAMYGVMPLFSADMSQGGGLNNEGLQVTVTTRAAEMGQRVFNDGFFPWLLGQYEITEWEMFLKPTEEKDDMAELQRDAMMLQNLQLARSQGLEVKRIEAQDNELKFEYGELGEPPEPTGMMPGQGSPEGDNQESKPALTVPTGEEQRFQGEPESVRRAFEVTKAFYMGKKIKPINGHRPMTEFKKTDEMSFDNIFSKAFDDVEKETGILLKRDTLDRDLRLAIKRNIFDRKFKNFTEIQSRRIKNKLIESLEKKDTLDQVIRSLKSIIPRMTTPEAERIIRTEQTAIVNTSREFGFKQLDPKGTRLYKWASIADNRRTSICKTITSRSSSGVPIEELKKIIREESRKGGQDGREWTPHFSCRSVVVRAF